MSYGCVAAQQQESKQGSEQVLGILVGMPYGVRYRIRDRSQVIIAGISGSVSILVAAIHLRIGPRGANYEGGGTSEGCNINEL